MLKNSILKLSQITILSIVLLSSNTANSATYSSSGNESTTSTSIFNTAPNNSFDELDFSKVPHVGKMKEDYLNALLQIKDNKLDQANNSINTLIKEHPDEASLYNLQGLLANVKGDSSTAISNFKKTIQLAPDNLLAHTAIAQLYLENDALESAKKYANKALDINDKLINAYYLLASIALIQNKPLDVENILLTAIEKNHDNSTKELSVINTLGKLYISSKQANKALNLAETTIKRHPNRVSALTLLANAQLINNQNKLAEDTIQKVITLDKGNIQFRLILARLWLPQLDKEKEVLKLLDEVSSLAPKNTQILTQKTAFLIQLKYYQEALDLASEIDKLSPGEAFSQLVAGEIHLIKKQRKQALTAYKKAFEIKPTIKVFYLIVDILIAEGKEVEAIEFLKQQLEKNNKNVAAHFKLATIYQKKNNLIGAEKHYKITLSLAPNNTLALNNLASLYHIQGNPKAFDLAKQAYELSPNVPFIAATYGEILIEQNNPKLAITVLNRAMELAPADYNIQYHLANAYTSNKQNKYAIRILGRILSIGKDFSNKQAAESLLKKLKK